MLPLIIRFQDNVGIAVLFIIDYFEDRYLIEVSGTLLK